MVVFAPGTNPYFSKFTCQGEQDLLEDLNIEAIKIYGLDFFYLPRTLISFDPIYGEDDISEYNAALGIEMYIKSVDGFEGDGTFLAKFGLEIRDQIVLTVARRTFELDITNTTTEIRPRPFEGDLIYYPLNEKLFQIKYVNYLVMHYPLGALQIWDLTCELYEYSNERINTGIEEIDELQTKFTTNILDFAIIDENGNYVIDENNNYLVSTEYAVHMANTDSILTDSEDIETEAVDVLDWSEKDPFSESDWGEF